MVHIIIYSPFPIYSGGRENWLYNIARIADKKNKEITIYSTYSIGKNFYDLSKFSKINLVRIPSLRLLNIIFLAVNKILFNIPFILDTFIVFNIFVKHKLKRRLKNNDTVIAMNSIIELIPVTELKKSEQNIDFKIVCSIRGMVVKELSMKMPYLENQFANIEKKLLSKCNNIIVNGQDTELDVKNKGYTSNIVPNGVDLEQFTRPYFDAKDIDLALISKFKNDGIKLIIMVASLRKIKGISDLIEAIPYLKNSYSGKFKVIFIGKGIPTQFNRLIKTLKLHKDILFLGEKVNIPSFLYYADVVACLSQGSGYSMSALEAMAAGKPIVAWDSPVYRQLITNDYNGKLIRFKNIEDLAHGILNLLTSSTKSLKEMGENARSEAEKYSWDNIYKALENYF